MSTSLISQKSANLLIKNPGHRTKEIPGWQSTNNADRFLGKKKTIYLKKAWLYLLDMFDLLWFKSLQVVKEYMRLMIIHQSMYRL